MEKFFCNRAQLKEELHGMTYLMELIDYEMSKAVNDPDHQGAVGGMHAPLNLSNEQVCFLFLIFLLLLSCALALNN